MIKKGVIRIAIALTLFFFGQAYSQDSHVVITKSNYKHHYPKWSPVEDLLLFISNMEGQHSVYVMHPSGNHLKRLTSLNHADSFASWSPDGKKISFSSLRNNKRQLFIYDLETKTQRPLIASTSDDFGASWSPDGQRIVYSSSMKGRGVFEVFVIDANGENKQQLTFKKRSSILPVFSSDGDWIFFQSDAFSNSSSKPDILGYHLPTAKIERISDPQTGAGIDPFIYAPNKKLGFFGGSKLQEGHGTYWIDLETKKMTKFDIQAKTPGYPTWSYDGKYATVIDRNLREIYIFDLETSTPINITAKLKMNRQ